MWSSSGSRRPRAGTPENRRSRRFPSSPATSNSGEVRPERSAPFAVVRVRSSPYIFPSPNSPTLWRLIIVLSSAVIVYLIFSPLHFRRRDWAVRIDAGEWMCSPENPLLSVYSGFVDGWIIFDRYPVAFWKRGVTVPWKMAGRLGRAVFGKFASQIRQGGKVQVQVLVRAKFKMSRFWAQLIKRATCLLTFFWKCRLYNLNFFGPKIHGDKICATPFP